MERCGMAIFSKSGRIDFPKRFYKQFHKREVNPFVIDQILEVATDKWQRKLEERFLSSYLLRIGELWIVIKSRSLPWLLILAYLYSIRYAVDIAIVLHPRRLFDFPIKIFIGEEKHSSYSRYRLLDRWKDLQMVRSFKRWNKRIKAWSNYRKI